MTVALAHLYALRAHLDAVILTAETEAGVSAGPAAEPGSCPQCGASPEEVEDTSTYAVKQRRCKKCEHEWPV